MGSIYTVVAQEEFETLQKELIGMGASLVEPLSLSLEDSFLLMNKQKEKGETNQ